MPSRWSQCIFEWWYFLIITIRKYLKSVTMKAVYSHQGSIWDVHHNWSSWTQSPVSPANLSFCCERQETDLTAEHNHLSVTGSVCPSGMDLLPLQVDNGLAGPPTGAGALSRLQPVRKGQQRPAEQPSIAHAKHGDIYLNMEHCISGTSCWRMLQECVHMCATWQVPGRVHASLCTFTYLLHVGGICCPAVRH